MSQFAIYSASAGSGKTYTLALDYLTLALAPDDSAGYKHILALTFTNDAAGEMKRRILSYLGDLRPQQPAEEARPLTAKIQQLLADLTRRLTERTTAFEGRSLTTDAERQQEVRRRAGEMFRRVLYDYADFAVGTIDSFGQRIVQAFARELGLPPAFEVELDTDAVLGAAVGLLLDQVNRPAEGNDPALTDLLRQYAEERGQEGRSLWGLAENVAEFSAALFNDTHLDVIRLLTDPRHTLADHHRWRELARDHLTDVELRLATLSTRALALIEEAGLTEKHLAGGAGGVAGHFRNALKKFQAGEVPTATARRAVEEDAWHSAEGKKAPFKERVDAISGELRTVFEELEALREQEQGGYVLLRAMQTHALGVALLGQVQQLVAAISRERGVVLIGEFNRRIAGVVLREPVPFVYEKLGERYRHLLLDEFQDTSALQWHNLLPLIENSLGNAQASLAVGDAKQAIYRWRGGELEQIVRLYRQEPERLLDRVRDPDTRALLTQRYETLTPALHPQTLRDNHRSRPEIVRFNNQLFTYFAVRWGEQVPLLAELYDDTFPQETPGYLQAGPAGHVELLLAPQEAPAVAYDVVNGQWLLDQPLPGYKPDEPLTYDETQLQLTLALIEQAHRRDGFALADIAVLCRTKAQSRAVAKQLKERDYSIVSADSLALSFADAVNLLVQLLRILHQPADGGARAAALLLIDKLVTHEPPAPERLRRVAELADPRQPARLVWDEVNAATGAAFDPRNAGNLGLYELTEQLISMLDLLARAPKENEYLFGFLDLTLDYSLRYGNNVGGFLDYWEQTGRDRPISTPSAGRDAITIQTVHKAKGLAYGVVIVPFADWPLRPRANSLLWGMLPPDTALPIADLPPAAVVTQNQALALTPLGAQYQDEQTRTFVEIINLLYVAFTRPRNRLYIIAKQAPEKKGAAKPDPDKLPTSIDGLLHDFLDAQPTWTPGAARFVFSAGAPAPPVTAADLPAGDADRSPWALTNQAAVPWTERLQLKRHATTVFDFLTQDRQREQSQLLHLALRRLDSASELQSVLHQLTAEGLVRAGQPLTDLRHALTDLLDHPVLVPLFRPGLTVLTDEPLLLPPTPADPPPPADYQPDRIVLDTEAADRVTLLDFRLPPTDPRHAEDQRAYAAHFRRLGYAEVRGIVYYLVTGEVVETVTA